MIKIGSFSDWLRFVEGTFQFGKHIGKDHRDVPDRDLQWYLTNVGVNRNFSRDFRNEIESYLKNRGLPTRLPQQPPAEPTGPRRPIVVKPPPKKEEPAAAPAQEGPKWWMLAKATSSHNNLVPGQMIAMTMRLDNSWIYHSLTGPKASGALSPEEVRMKIVQSVRDANNDPIKAGTLADLAAKIPSEESQPEKTPREAAAANKHILPMEKLSEEQKMIDAKFEKLANNPGQSHMMINALAGTGKTTILKHLAWKYGNKGQKWLYLVFNSKNKEEAKGKFPPWVEVATTNGFLGGKNVLESKENKRRIPPTERTVNLGKRNEGSEDDEEPGSEEPSKKEENERGGRLEKIRILADSPEFGKFMEHLGLPAEDAVDKIPNLRANNDANNKTKKTIAGLLKSIRWTFKEEVLRLAGLAKSYSVDPRQRDDLHAKIDEIMEKYDFDTDIEEVKDRIDKYEDYGYSFRQMIETYLNKALGYDFMSKNYKNEMVQASIMMLNDTMPHASNHIYSRNDVDYNMGRFRDFNDDLWFASIHADEIHWPHYDYVLADEVQDFNENQKIVLKKLHEAGAKIVAVGDPNQSIYRFRGADSSAFNNIGSQLKELSQDKDIEHTLSLNFRSRPAILDFANANTSVKGLKAGKTFADGDPGTVTDQEINYNDTFKTVGQERAQKGTGMRQTAFIARTNEPLIEASLNLLAAGVPFVFVGKDIGKDLEKHINSVMRLMKVTDYSPVSDLSMKLQTHLGKEQERYSGRSTKKEYMREITDTTNAILGAIGTFDPNTPTTLIGGNYGSEDDYRRGPRKPSKTVGEFRKWLKTQLGGLNIEDNKRDLDKYEKMVEDLNPVILTTSHKSKGLEFSRVYILRDDQFPHPKAVKSGRAEELAQEDNAKYVAYTRAMDELHIVKLKGQPGYKDQDDDTSYDHQRTGWGPG